MMKKTRFGSFFLKKKNKHENRVKKKEIERAHTQHQPKTTTVFSLVSMCGCCMVVAVFSGERNGVGASFVSLLRRPVFSAQQVSGANTPGGFSAALPPPDEIGTHFLFFFLNLAGNTHSFFFFKSLFLFSFNILLSLRFPKREEKKEENVKKIPHTHTHTHHSYVFFYYARACVE